MPESIGTPVTEAPAVELIAEGCPAPAEILIPGCEDFVSFDMGSTGLSSPGRILQLDVTLRSVCPGKRVAASIILTETDPEGLEHPRGVKHVLVPAQTGEGCRDITLRCIQFSLPEALDAAGQTASICGPRNFRARVIANYVDSDFVCCGAEAVLG